MLRRTLVASLALAFAAHAPGQEAAQPRLDTIVLNAGIHNIRAELARTAQQQQVGLMHRREMGTSDGMLFVYGSPATRCFWMKNTPLPLSVAFLADDGTVVNIADMAPLKLDSHCSARPVRYALEMHQGWFAQRGIQPGTRLQGEPFKR